ncbi:MAG TPA: TolC family protein [Bacteroidota bacterium]|nr:TolC family protein [Bacteroidota bacterium]
MNRSTILGLALGLGALCAEAQQEALRREAPALRLTLDSAVTLALSQNREVLMADRERDRADAQIAEATSGALPQLSVSGLYTRNVRLPVLFLPPNTVFNPGNSTETLELGSNNSYLLGATLSQTLYSRKVGVALDIANTYRDYSEQAYRATSQDVTLAVRRAFYGVLLARELAAVNREGLEVVRTNVENVRSLYNHGSAAEYELLRAEVELANTEPLAIAADNALVLSLNALKEILAIPLDADLDVVGEFAFREVPQRALEDARERAPGANPALLGLRLQEDMLQMNISIERASLFPTLSLIGSYQYQTQDNTFAFRSYLWATSLSVGLQVSFPLFDGFRSSARIDQAVIDRDRAHLALLSAEQGLRLRLQAAELRMQEAARRIRGQEQNIAQATKAVRIAQTRYRNGVGTQLELMDSEAAMTRARATRAQALYDFLIAQAEWENAAGISTQR